MTLRLADLTIGATIPLSPTSAAPEAVFLNREDSMIRLSALAAAAFALAVFVGGSLAQAQTASDPKSQPGSGQCRLSNGQRC
jgi:hypothetical protein